MRRAGARRFVVPAVLTKRELDHFLGRTISRLRWATIGALLLISLAQPNAGRGRVPDWALITLFAGYNLLLELLQRHLLGRRAFVWAAVLDLPAVGLVYFNCAQPGGPLFVLLVMAATQTTAFMTLAGSLLYTAAIAAIVIAVEPTLPLWSSSLTDVRALTGRLIVLALVSVGTGALTRRLEDERAVAQSVRSETERLEELDRVRADFIATVSHDLRAPLTAARAALGLLSTSAINRCGSDDEELLVTARRNVERLSLLIDDLLAYNQLAAGTLRLDREPLDLRVVVADAVASVHPLLREKGQMLALDLPVSLPYEGDGERLEQVMTDLVANAHGHTPAGTEITVSGRIVARNIRISVRDNGPGIPAAELEAIFQRFYRLAEDRSGSGLGLAIARAIVELHGGRLWAESQSERGIAFHLELPRTEAVGAP